MTGSGVSKSVKWQSTTLAGCNDAWQGGGR